MEPGPVITNQPTRSTQENDHSNTQQLTEVTAMFSEVDNAGVNEVEEEKKKQQQRLNNGLEEDVADICCCLAFAEETDTFCIHSFCFWIGQCCSNVNSCMESCCDGCADCLHSCCESSGGGDISGGDGGDDDCCSGLGDCCTGCVEVCSACNCDCDD